MTIEQLSSPSITNIKKVMVDLGITKYQINPDGSVDVKGNVILRSRTTSIPVQFGSVSGDFFCHITKVTSLQGAPHTVGGDFYCQYTDITSLQGAPRTVGGDFYCQYTDITSLSGIHKTHRSWVVAGTLAIHAEMTNIIGLALIRGINTVRLVDGARSTTFDISHHDPLVFQEQLIDAGLTAQAKM